MATFDTQPLRPELLQATAQMGFVQLTPIQEQALPPILAGRDVSGQAKTGSGKTAAFGLGLLQGITPALHTQALVLCPTRELADQVAAELRRLAARMDNVQVLCVTGGRAYRNQIASLEGGAQIVVGTPGRIGKHLDKETLDLSQLQVLVLDEADRMLDMGFVDQVLRIVQDCPSVRQTLLFSATFPDGIHGLSRQVQRDPVHLSVSSRVEEAQLVQQHVRVPWGRRNDAVLQILAHHTPERALVFCETKGDCDSLARFLSGRGTVALALHGDLDQRDRDEVMLRFSGGSACVVVATNVAARGLDIPALPLVVIAELGGEVQAHVHRIGRTARAEQQGLAISVVCGDREPERLAAIEDFTGVRIPEVPVPQGGHSLAAMRPPNQTLLILAGRQDKLRKGDVLGALVKDGGIPAQAIGQIDLLPRVTAVAISTDHARAALRYLQAGRIKKKRVRARLL